MTDQPQGSLETRQDVEPGGAGLVQLWLDAIAVADKEEEKWRTRAKQVSDLYRDSGDRTTRRFNILYANVETIVPALYNSVPVPDVRRRFSDKDDAGRQVSQIIERALSYSVDAYDFDTVMADAVRDEQVVGRGISRVRYAPSVVDGYTYEEARCEHVQWSDFRRGPGRKWSDVPWIAFKHLLTRDQLIQLNEKVGGAIPLDTIPDGVTRKDDQSEPPDLFKRGLVWEIWDSQAREVVFIAPAYKDDVLRREPDPLGLQGFFPIPRPLYDLDATDTLLPTVPYDIYRDQAEELDRITRRITALVSALKWRGVAAGEIVSSIAQLQDKADGEFVPTENAGAFLSGGGSIDKAIWLMPIEQAAMVLKELYGQREQIKSTIYELCGIADIMRGQTDPRETKGAQQIKAQWGSLRLQRKQSDVARYARDLFRLKAEIICGKFSTENLSLMTGIEITPDVEKLLRSDILRQYRIDIETDSTIRADLTRAQENMSAFLQGFAQYIQAVGPAVQQGAMPMDVATDLLTSFARAFKLGRQAEDALERLGTQAQQGMPGQAQAQQSQQMEMQAQQQAMQMEQMKLQGQMQVEQVKGQAAMQQAQTDQMRAQQDAQFAQAEHALKMEELELKRQMSREKHQADLAKIAAQMAAAKAAPKPQPEARQ
jgi:hypothetical protein